MKQEIIYILVLFTILFVIEKKASNILLSFVAIIITLAFLLPSLPCEGFKGEEEGLSIESEYFSYILILVQVSGLTILFGFILMLFPNLSHSSPQNSYIQNNQNKPYNQYIIIILSMGIIFLLYLYSTKSYLFIDILDILYNFKLTGLEIRQEIINKIETTDTYLLRKIGRMLYTEDPNILKLFLITLILLVALISLFFLL